jgi:hypothetical protein
MKYPEVLFESQKQRNIATLEAATDKPIVVISSEPDSILVQTGILESLDLSSDNMRLTHVNGAMDITIDAAIPDEDIVVAGEEQILSYIEYLLEKYQSTGQTRGGVVAVTILDRFAKEDDKERIEQLGAEIAEDIISGISEDDMLAPTILDAPAHLRQPVIKELQRRLGSHQTFHEISTDWLLSSFIMYIHEFYGISELQAASMILKEENVW